MAFRLAVICLICISSAINISGEQASVTGENAAKSSGLRTPREVVRGVFQSPHATVEALQPKGFRVSIPDEPGIKLFAFHGRINEPLDLLEAGEYSVDIMKSKNGRWTYQNNKVKLNIGDTINFWTMVHHSFDGEDVRGYRIDDETFTVTSFGGGQIRPVQTTTPYTPIVYRDYIDVRFEDPVCTPSPTKLLDSKPVCAGSLIFEENFEDSQSSKFTPEVLIADQPDYPFVVYMKKDHNLFYRDGSVIIRPQLYEQHYPSLVEELDIKTICTAPADSDLCYEIPNIGSILPPVISSKITTKNKFSFTYGKIEIIAKVPAGDWIYPDMVYMGYSQIWLIPEIQLEPKDNDYGEKFYASGIMRIALTKGNEKFGHELEAGVIMDSDSDVRRTNMKFKTGTSNWSSDFHNYTMVWRQDRVIVSVDGEEFGTIAPIRGRLSRGSNGKANPAEELWRLGDAMAPFDKPFYIALGVAVGGHEFQDNADKPWTNGSPKARLNFWKNKVNWFPSWNADSRLQVKSVKVYAL